MLVVMLSSSRELFLMGCGQEMTDEIRSLTDLIAADSTLLSELNISRHEVQLLCTIIMQPSDATTSPHSKLRLLIRYLYNYN